MIITQKESASPAKGTKTFMPKNPAIIIGTVRRTVAKVKIFIMPLTLLLMIEANVPIVEEMVAE